MSEPEPPPAPPAPPPTLAYQNTPNAERYVLEADAMRRRQLRSALLHGSRRTWREHSRAWPAVVVGLIVVAVIIAGLAVTQAFQKTEQNQKKQEKQNKAPSSAPLLPGREASRAA
jgi:flagellar biosynthesis/type III secretory pathway M-ring protein FliF/YscJ